MKKLRIVLIIVAAVGALAVATALLMPMIKQAVEDTLNPEMTITEGDLTMTVSKDFIKRTSSTMLANQWVYTNADITISAVHNDEEFLRENHYELDDIYHFANSFVAQHGDEFYSEVYTDRAYPYVEYEEKQGDTFYKVLEVFFEGSDGYYCVNFICEEHKYYQYQADFFKWADTIVVE